MNKTGNHKKTKDLSFQKYFEEDYKILIGAWVKFADSL